MKCSWCRHLLELQEMVKRRESKTCSTCGKQVIDDGRVSAWLFRKSSCTCRTPRLVEDRVLSPRASLANRLNSRERPQQSFNGFEVLESLGEGGMSKVFKVKRKCDGQILAIKLLRTDLARDQSAVMRFKQEVKAVTKLTHANLVSTYDIAETDDGIPFFSMDFVDGNNLGVIISDGSATCQRNLEILIAVSEAISHAHEHKIIHRDIKPSNILVSREGLVKVVDFGIAKVLAAATTSNTGGLTQTGDVFGSPLYMSPEQCMGEAVDARSDIYSIGCVMYEMFTGSPPFQGANSIRVIFGHVNEKPKKMQIADESEKLKEELNQVVTCCLAKKPQDRYQTVRALVDDLNSVAGGKLASNARKSPMVRRDLLRRITIAAGTLGVIVGTLGVANSVTQVTTRTSTAERPESISRLIASFTNEINAHPQDDYWYIMRGTTYRESGDLVNALADFTQAIKINPNSAKAFRERGWTYARMEKWQNATRDNSKAIEIDPQFADAYIGRARDYIALGQFDRALEDANKAIELNPHNQTAYLTRASAHFNLADYEKAKMDCDQTVRLVPDDPHPRILRSRVAERLGQFEEAIRDLTFILEKQPDDVPRRIERAYVYNRSQQFAKALEDAKRIHERDGKHVGAFIEKGRALSGLDRAGEALAEFEKCLLIDPSQSDVLKLAGDACVKLRRFDEAIAKYSMALKLRPDFIDAKEAIEETARLRDSESD